MIVLILKKTILANQQVSIPHDKRKYGGINVLKAIKAALLLKTIVLQGITAITKAV